MRVQSNAAFVSSTEEKLNELDYRGHNVRSDRQFATGKVGRHRVESALRDCGRETALSHQSSLPSLGRSAAFY